MAAFFTRPQIGAFEVRARFSPVRKNTRELPRVYLEFGY
jgi:hypothetical protein